MDFEVRRDDLHRCRWADAAAPVPSAGQALLAVERFGFSANNITYAVMGDSLGYWSFFPAEQGWGRIPVWGFARVIASRHPGLNEGSRVFGYLPPSSRLLVTPDRVNPGGFVDASVHRAQLPPAYNSYNTLDSDLSYQDQTADFYLLLRPLFFLSFMLDDFLCEQEWCGARRLLLSSASSKAALGLAYLAARRGGIEVIGLTSAHRVAELERLGVYGRVLDYGSLAALDSGDSAYIDLSGDGALRAAVHAHCAERLRLSLSAGATHWQAPTELPALPGPKPQFFFTPDRIVKRSRDWGRAGLNQRFAKAWHPFVDWTRTWLKIREAAGAAAIEQVYREVLGGHAAFDLAHVLVPNP
jgi:hypothetical protein